MADQHRPRVWKAGQDCWAVTDDYFCEELDQMIYTTRLLRTWREAMQYVRESLWPMYSR